MKNSIIIGLFLIAVAWFLYEASPVVLLLGQMIAQAHKGDKVIAEMPPQRMEKLIRDSVKWTSLRFDDPRLAPGERYISDRSFSKAQYEQQKDWVKFDSIPNDDIPDDFKDLDPIYVAIRYQESVTIAYVGGIGHVGMRVSKLPSGTWVLEKYDDEHQTLIKEMQVNQ
jgi:hypothetical protein